MQEGLQQFNSNIHGRLSRLPALHHHATRVHALVHHDHRHFLALVQRLHTMLSSPISSTFLQYLHSTSPINMPFSRCPLNRWQSSAKKRLMRTVLASRTHTTRDRSLGYIHGSSYRNGSTYPLNCPPCLLSNSRSCPSPSNHGNDSPFLFTMNYTSFNSGKNCSLQWTARCAT